MRNRGRWTLGLVLLAGAGLLTWRLWPRPVPLPVAVVARGPLRETVRGEGQSRVRDRFVVAAPVAGRLTRVAWRAGDSVRAGQVVAWLDPAPLDARSRQQAEAQIAALEDACRTAEAQVRAAEAGLDQARRDRLRSDSLAAGGNLAPAARESAELAETTRRRELEAVRARAETARHEVERARAALVAAQGDGPAAARTALRAPVSGRVLRILEESDRVLLAGTPVLELGDLGRLELVADLLSTEAVRVRPGDTVLVEAWGGDSVLRGRVRLVEPSGFTKVSALGVEEQRVNVIAELPDPPPALGDRFRVEVRIVLWGGADVLQVPESALLRTASGWEVLSVEAGRLRRLPVQVGHRGEFAAEVVSGVATGALVVRHPTADLQAGQRVRPLREEGT